MNLNYRKIPVFFWSAANATLPQEIRSEIFSKMSRVKENCQAAKVTENLEPVSHNNLTRFHILSFCEPFCFIRILFRSPVRMISSGFMTYSH